MEGYNGGWVWQDSNLQPSHYEWPALTVELQTRRCGGEFTEDSAADHKLFALTVHHNM